MSESLTERIKHWNTTKPNEIMQAFSSDLYEIVQRAEAAEARAADAEIRAKSWHDSAMTLADQRDAAYKRNTELEAERDELARKLEIAYAVCDNLRMSIVNNVSA